MTATKRFIPYNGTGTSTDGLLLILTSAGQSRGYVWERSYPGGGTALPPKTISRYLLGANDVRVYLQQQDKLLCGDQRLSASWVPFQNQSDVWVNYYANNTVNLSLDGRSIQAVTNLSPCRNWGSSENDWVTLKKATVGTKNLLPFNGGPQKITCLMVYPEPQYYSQKCFFWEQEIEPGASGIFGPARQLRMLSFEDKVPVAFDYVKLTIFVGLGDTTETSVLYSAPNLKVDLADGEGDTIYLNFYSSNMTVNVSLDGKNVHASTKLVALT